jgi:response regulator RpfG family c-di-GMP phosphodiesterase
VADVWDALYATDRPYRKPLPKEAVREHIRSLAGSYLDPKVVEEFLKLEW